MESLNTRQALTEAQRARIAELAPLARGLVLNDSEDRCIFRLRVLRHYSGMGLQHLRAEAQASRFTSRTECVNAIAAEYIKLIAPCGSVCRDCSVSSIDGLPRCPWINMEAWRLPQQ